MNRPGFRSTAPLRSRQAGISLIELMVALLIASLLTLGLIQIFGAARITSQMQEGLSRVQENGRFATNYMQRQLRMVGFMGCGADSDRIAHANFVNHLALYDGSVPSGSAYRFQRPIEAFTVGTDTLPAELTSETGSLVEGSDVLIMRVFSEESVPILDVNRDGMTLNINIANGSASFLPESGSAALFAMENCRSADVFAGILSGTTLTVIGGADPNVYRDPTVDGCGSSGCPWDFRISNATLNSRPITGGPARLNAEIHRADYVALYVRKDADGKSNLYVKRLKRAGWDVGSAESLVDGVENMQLRFGYDASASPDGAVDEYRTAAEVSGGATNDEALDENWRRVLSVRVALLLRSPDKAGVTGPARSYDLLGVTVMSPADGVMRQVYETTIAVRNRLFNS